MEKRKIKIKVNKKLEERCQKGYKTHPKRKTKKMFGRTYRNCVKAEGKVEEVYSDKQRRFMCAVSKQGADRPEGLSKAEAEEMCKGPMKEGDPKKGTGKKPKGSGRRLYTDENPKDTVGVKFSSVSDIRDTFSKASFKSKSHKRQSQIINLVHQRVRAAYKNAKDPKVKKRLKKAFDYAKKRKEASKRKTIRMRKKKKVNESRMPREEALQKAMAKYDIDVGEELGSGAYGSVYAGVSDRGPVAIKMISKYWNMPTVERELKMYNLINDARKSPAIAKHFPEVYFTDHQSDKEYAFIVMERLEVQQGYQRETINILFGGYGAGLAPDADEREMTGKFVDRSNRLYVLFKNEKSQKALLDSMYNNLPADLDFLQPVVKQFLGFIDNYVAYVKSTDKAMKEIIDMGISTTAEDYLFTFPNLVDPQIKDEFKSAPWYLTFILVQLRELKKKDPSGMLFKANHESLIRFWLSYYRMSSIIGLSDTPFSTDSMDRTGVEQDQVEAFKEAVSIKKALKELKEDYGIYPRDMHDKNVMVRPETGDIVIMDVGLFYEN